MSKYIELDDLLKKCKSHNYSDQAAYIHSLIREGKIEEVKRSPLNGKTPPLKTRYRLISKPMPPEKIEELQREISCLTPPIKTEYYFDHLDVFEKERKDVKQISQFLRRPSLIKTAVSYRQRSFQIFHREKHLMRMTTTFKHCGLLQDGQSIQEALNCYDTKEPFAYFSFSKKTPQNILILENCDPFFDMRMCLQEYNQHTILGVPIHTLIYGKGKDVISTFNQFDRTAENYMKSTNNQLYYYGDLDYEGIKIFENLAEKHPELHIKPFIPAYLAMLKKSNDTALPLTKEGQNRNLSGLFFSYFEAEDVENIQLILKANNYIPQEILLIEDY